MSTSWIERMREKPKHVRTQVSFLAAVSFTGIIALIWVATLPMRLGSIEYGESPVVAEAEDTSFFAEARSGLAQIIGAVRGEGVVTEENTGAVSETGTYRVGAPIEENPGTFETYYGSGQEATVVIPQENERRVIIGTSTSR